MQHINRIVRKCMNTARTTVAISHTELSVLAALNLCKRLKSSSKHVVRFLFNKYSKAFLWQFFNTMSLS